MVLSHLCVQEAGTYTFARFGTAGTLSARMSVHTSKTTDESSIARERLTLANSVVRLEAGPAGTVARISRADDVDYAGPLDDATIAALREVSA